MSRRASPHPLIFSRTFRAGDEGGARDSHTLCQGASHALVDLLQGLQLRAKVGIAREQLLQDARSYVLSRFCPSRLSLSNNLRARLSVRTVPKEHLDWLSI